MAGETPITLVGNVVADPELRFTPSGAAVANFRVASTPRTFDRTTNEWKDGDPLFLGVSVWRQQAENVAETITRGMRVIVVGRLGQRQYEKDGERKSSYEIQADEVAPALKNATAKVTKNGPQSAQQQPTQGYAQQAPQQGYGAPQANQWAQQQPTHGYSDEPPF
ncbi:single-stranded DNA-binding protein [Streptomyces sp. ISL-112]|uniref:single-stranded DNA-binding protein n=1 Tax=unclassified Streptomyces TaxID=2593676 RepID=UPI001BE6C420|nr:MULTISPECIES: single-stranded DNA-binding protein [unclassified Streptomyces]MBT2427226.1 single-stranded DNA-binding protein [Streptomyces sp. ISL-112]MBT2465770.1 single-stranded DNA-binding protein [Streptomyces sp. ISL-63]